MKTMWLFLGLVVGTISANIQADSQFNTQQIRHMVQQGEILSLEKILAKLTGSIKERLLDLEVRREGGLIIYELEFLRQNGDVVELEIDAASGRILEQEIEH